MNGLGLVIVLVVHGICFHDGREGWKLDIQSAYLLVGAALGSLASAFFLPFFRRQRRHSIAFLLCALPGILSALSFLLGLLHDMPLAAAAGCGLIALPFTYFLDNIARANQQNGLFLGIVFGVAVLFWQIPTIFPPAGEQQALAVGVCVISFLSGLTTFLINIFLPKEYKDSSSFSDLSDNENGTENDFQGRKSGFETLIYITGITVVFFLLTSLMDWQFYRMHASNFRIPSWAYLYLWAACPLVGYWLEKRVADTRILLCCLAAVILLPLLVIPLDGTSLYWAVYVVVLFVKIVGVLFLLLVFLKFRTGYGKELPHGLILCLPWSCLLISFYIAKVFIYYYVGIVPYFFLLIILSASFGYLSLHVQYAMSLSVAKRENIAYDIYNNNYIKKSYGAFVDDINMAEFSKKYGFSNREQDVARLILENVETKEIIEKLCITKNTLKTHVRQILRKSESKNRNELILLFIKENENKLK
ncbi:MAG: helix-turn-helix transcriptional regulator [Desulfovibrio sp.]|nr:helix-turn-helix transcriptional regulator [Desulfovibrio sp.]